MSRINLFIREKKRLCIININNIRCQEYAFRRIYYSHIETTFTHILYTHNKCSYIRLRLHNIYAFVKRIRIKCYMLSIEKFNP